MKKFIIFILLLCSKSLVGVQQPYIQDVEKHKENQKILRAVVEQELAPYSASTPSEKAAHLSGRITNIAKEVMKQGFSTDAYALPKKTRSPITFDYFVLWEGEKNPGNIPLTFFVYAWPSSKYGSVIHSHPIPCALAVLKGNLSQKNYRIVSEEDKIARFVEEKVFHEGEGEVDDLTKSFIHRLYNPGPQEIALSLHAYGLSSEKKVMRCFEQTSEECCYEEESFTHFNNN